ncbi:MULTISPECIES: polysaccharide pyruvyl transferase family protein [unclassified Rhizobium]|uniref:polysaccharide pyruvyl transferase family protein n=1 Tax=unclassified Rhizobium TaxID=2613769 RepID=UPI001A99E5BB|nr:MULTISPECIES: polysaccharide pyruvyl transferase family protein [unclassified Rhizobium]MBX5159306.1 exopolysaccharide biosynthesis protein [Rhizobium sp. NZLR8]MBX5162050.1 exopolysaccharide biosynthesis protein [Rhizobium sp. NZLR4b]MBX5171076.1 exopolysaccharide biosynthesis protein [Rhizobium sp. NZLR1b]MBX5188109.1 exopolysaccharide biosynthesis protein [Rhizobium sp. NZLR3b]MBX5197739.1 exopolysaccharide biosynthesis protein [Rhizobium sp. NZLR10]
MYHLGEVAIRRLQEKLIKSVRKFVSRGQPYIIMDFPSNKDPGHHASWLGLAKVLQDVTGRLPVLTGGSLQSINEIKDTPGDAPIFICGWADFGDARTGRDDIRYRLACKYPDRTIIQMPQTIDFANEALMEYAKRTIGRHRNFFFMTRDEQSFDLAKANFDCDVEAGPDTAFGIGLLKPFEADPLRVLYVMQPFGEDDVDLAEARAIVDGPLTNWISGPDSLSRLRKSSVVKAAMRRGFSRSEMVAQHHEDVAARYVDYGVKMLSGAQRIITNRLHGHALCLLINKPHVAVARNGSKLHDFISSWTGDTLLVEKAANASELLAAMSRLPYEMNGAWYKSSRPIDLRPGLPAPDLVPQPSIV